jgi:TMEM175 potassium channel family protein
MADGSPELRDTDRIRALSDGVFGFAMTLLAIDLRLPPGTTPANLTQALLALGPHYFAFALSFIVIGAYWAGHRRLFAHVAGADDRLVWLNLLMLASVAFLPFPTAVVASLGETVSGVVFYAAAMTFAGLLMAVMWLYISSQPSVAAAGLDRRTFLVHTIRGFAPPLVFGASIPVAILVTPAAARLVWFVLGGAFLLFDLVSNGRGESGEA